MKKDWRYVNLFSWQNLGDQNITFADELVFDVSELDFVFDEQMWEFNDNELWLRLSDYQPQLRLGARKGRESTPA